MRSVLRHTHLEETTFLVINSNTWLIELMYWHQVFCCGWAGLSDSTDTTDGIAVSNVDQLPYATLTYANGPGFIKHNPRHDLRLNATGASPGPNHDHTTLSPHPNLDPIHSSKLLWSNLREDRSTVRLTDMCDCLTNWRIDFVGVKQVEIREWSSCERRAWVDTLILGIPPPIRHSQIFMMFGRV